MRVDKNVVAFLDNDEDDDDYVSCRGRSRGKAKDKGCEIEVVKKSH